MDNTINIAKEDQDEKSVLADTKEVETDFNEENDRDFNNINIDDNGGWRKGDLDYDPQALVLQSIKSKEDVINKEIHTPSKNWKCIQCSFLNPPSNTTCISCKKSRNTSDITIDDYTFDSNDDDDDVLRESKYFFKQK